jgi:hypothetical protein
MEIPTTFRDDPEHHRSVGGATSGQDRPRGGEPTAGLGRQRPVFAYGVRLPRTDWWKDVTFYVHPSLINAALVLIEY